ncbi:hypothetical protein KV102_10020 [Mumia sp. zg.B53]|uniref:hypothetical protein n=1 Tax=unclassified Mumia TaxID=2621872 RepID=UPI001C6EABEB|nr:MULTISPECIES: hypothetical protein [unclassified Mumia]MBW9210562.1 hypothetical protein [Mumia sp. zg.B21]MBW9215175.1 hypothetical protein [Mumia sp. zg.B53]MDD9347601.1 hypothetical protein [Mumia sp.]
MKLRTLAVFGIGYVLGTKAGRDRYEQIVAAARRAGQRIEQYGDPDGAGGSRVS